MKPKTCNLKAITLFALALSAAASGCSSIKSTLFSYDGCQDCTRVQKHLKGVPTTLEVPTHLQVTVRRTRWGLVDPTNGTVTFAQELDTREVAFDTKTQKEIFTVDFKRPAAGTLDYSLTFDKNKQYITKIDNSIEDKTIADVTTLITAILQTVPPARANTRELDAGGKKLTPFHDVVASEVFALSEPDLQNRIQAFLATYVNQCHATCGPCNYPAPSPRCAPCSTPAPVPHP